MPHITINLAYLRPSTLKELWDDLSHEHNQQFWEKPRYDMELAMLHVVRNAIEEYYFGLTGNDIAAPGSSAPAAPNA